MINQIHSHEDIILYTNVIVLIEVIIGFKWTSLLFFVVQLTSMRKQSTFETPNEMLLQVKNWAVYPYAGHTEKNERVSFPKLTASKMPVNLSDFV